MKFYSRNSMRGILMHVMLFAVLQASGQQMGVSVWKDPDANFGDYQSFNWAAHADAILDENRFFLDDLVLKADVKHAIKNELQKRDYVMNRLRPDLVVNMRVFDYAAVLNGFSGYGARYWRDSNFDPSTDDRRVEVEAGTLIISILDRDKRRVIWQGFVSGLMDGDEFTRDEKKIRNAVSLLFEEYDIPVGEYTRR